MALIDQATLAADVTFKLRVQAAVVKRATVALGANPTSDVLSLARRILSDPASTTAQIVWAIATDATIATAAGSPAVQGSVTDAQINTAVVALLPLFVV